MLVLSTLLYLKLRFRVPSGSPLSCDSFSSQPFQILSTTKHNRLPVDKDDKTTRPRLENTTLDPYIDVQETFHLANPTKGTRVFDRR